MSDNNEYKYIINLCNKRESDKGDFEKLNTLINEKNINGVIGNDNTPLSISLMVYNYELIELLLKKGANVNLYGKYGYGFAYIHGSIKKQFYKTYSTYLHYAIQNEIDEWAFYNKNYSGYCNVPTKTIELLIKYGADINAFNQIWETPLDIAIDSSNDSARDLLLSLGAKTSKELIDSGQIYEGWKNTFIKLR